MKSLIRAALGVAFCLAVGTIAYASVTYNPVNCTGFVGKGDVQLVCGGNNADMQSYATGVTFNYTSTATYLAVCTFTTGEGTRGEKIHNVTRTVQTGYGAAVNNDPRKVNGQKQFTGFILTGCGSTTSGGEDVPVVGGSCPGGGPEGGTWTSVTLQTGGSSNGLYVTCPTGSPNAGNSYLLQ